MELQKALGLAIKDIRNSKGLSQEYFSDISSRTYLSVLENGKKKPSVEKIDTLAKAMGVHPLTILTLAYLKTDSDKDLIELQRVISNEISEVL
ncbi:MAG TPA: helix-turn-helix transcriptional regulator [Methylophilaceae bacterium]|jgi:transcriptional regulator with XRE-family HTH domain